MRSPKNLGVSTNCLATKQNYSAQFGCLLYYYSNSMYFCCYIIIISYKVLHAISFRGNNATQEPSCMFHDIILNSNGSTFCKLQPQEKKLSADDHSKPSQLVFIYQIENNIAKISTLL